MSIDERIHTVEPLDTGSGLLSPCRDLITLKEINWMVLFFFFFFFFSSFVRRLSLF